MKIEGEFKKLKLWSENLDISNVCEKLFNELR